VVLCLLTPSPVAGLFQFCLVTVTSRTATAHSMTAQTVSLYRRDANWSYWTHKPTAVVMPHGC